HGRHAPSFDRSGTIRPVASRRMARETPDTLSRRIRAGEPRPNPTGGFYRDGRAVPWWRLLEAAGWRCDRIVPLLSGGFGWCVGGDGGWPWPSWPHSAGWWSPVGCWTFPRIRGTASRPRRRARPC